MPKFTTFTGTQLNAIRGAANIGSDNDLIYRAPVGSLGDYLSPEVDLWWLQNNSSGADLIGGIGLRIHNSQWIAGSWDNSETGSRYIDDTADAQDRNAADDFSMYCTADDDGMVIGSRCKFGWITLDIDTENSANAATKVEYWQNDSSWQIPAATSVKLDEFTITGAKTGTGETSYIWDPANDWGKVGDVAYGSVITAPDASCPPGFYYMRVRIDNADVSAGNVTMSALEIGIHLAEENIDDTIIATRGPNLGYYSPFCDAVIMINTLYGTGNVAYRVDVRAR